MSENGGPGRSGRVHREVGTRRVGEEEARTFLLRRTYGAAVEDVWDACTDPERLGRWLLPVSGELKPGGRFQLEGNAHGEILECERPRLLKLTWLVGDNPDHGEVELRLTPEGDGTTVFELEHTVVVPPEEWEHFGPGGIGLVWDLTALGLHFHLLDGTDGSVEDLAAWRESEEAREFMTGSSAAWGAAYEASGAPADVAEAAAHATTAFYVPPREEVDG